jgi:hypothetical protein
MRHTRQVLSTFAAQPAHIQRQLNLPLLLNNACNTLGSLAPLQRHVGTALKHRLKRELVCRQKVLVLRASEKSAKPN